MFGIKFNRNRRTQVLARARRPVVECLEGRSMMSTTIFVGDGTLEPITENQAITNNTVATVAAYDTNDKPLSDLSGFTAKIDWGDGKGTSDGTIGPKVSGNYFAIEGSHTYDKAGIYPISLHVVANDGTSADQKVERADVQDASMTTTPHLIAAVAGEQFTKTLADLIDGDTASKASDFTADIRWGDNTPTDQAQIVSTGGGQFQLIGSHAYAKPGRFYASVTVTDAYGAMTSTTCLVNVAAASTTPTTPGTPPGADPTPAGPTTPADPTTPMGPTTPTTPVQPPSTPSQPPTIPTAPTTPTTPVQPPAAPANPVTPPDTTGSIAWGKKVTPAFKAKLIQIAAELGADPNDLMGAMGFESGQTFSPKIKNRLGSGAVGLIQFMPSTARGLGTSTAALAKMSAVQQLDYVYKYLKPYTGQLNSLGDVYMSILWPAAVGKPDSYGLFRKGTRAYTQNKGLDTNKDGVVTRGEATARVTQTLQLGQTPAYFG